ncbi:MAG: putative cation:proton antiport protein [Methanomassiliicoccales archaeon PtaB.Bin134]|nr:MAG: putative cation:proton antiport protein [Methanomassiliicoccales archaeon PtaB.Bin134]
MAEPVWEGVMIATDSVMFEVGVIMLVSFIGAALASKAKQSVILGYILAGILIGPYIHFTIGGFTYDGLVKDTEFIRFLSEMGLTLLMFFVGLGFSVTKLKKTKTPAIILALMDVGIGMFLGILIGFALDWPLVDTVFLAGVISMSSVAITGKALQELERISSPETEYLLGMVIVESFLSMVLLTIAGGLMFESGSSSMSQLIVGILAFYGFFIFLAILVVPRVIKYFERIKSDELFVLFALGLVFLSAALAQVAGVPAIIGAFFLGMVFAETKLVERMEDRISPFRDALVAVFFVAFGMLIDLSMLGMIVPLLLIAIPVVLFYEVILVSAISYLLGFASRSAIFMGTSITGRASEAVMYASVGSSSPAVVKGAELNPFAGAFCFVMSIISPGLMKHSSKVTGALTRVTPSVLRYGGSLINRTMSKIILPSGLKLFERTKRLEVLVICYFATLVAVMVLPFPYEIISFLVGAALVGITYQTLKADLYIVVRITNFDNLGVVTRDPGHISRYIAGFVSLSLVTILSIAYLFRLWWASSLVLLLAYFIIVMLMTRTVYQVTRTPSFNLKAGPVVRRPAKKKQKPFQPNFRAPAPRPDPGWDVDPPSSRTEALQEPGPEWRPETDRTPPEEDREAAAPKRKRRNAEATPAPDLAEEEKWGRL